MAKKITQKRLYNIALYHLSRYETTTEKLKAVLQRRVRKAKFSGDEVDGQAAEWIEQIVASMQRQGFVDDNRFAANNIERWFLSGKSLKYIQAKLHQAGLDPHALLDFEAAGEKDLSEWERAAAETFVRKKKLGPYRPAAAQKEKYAKDLASVARAGFPLDLAKEVLNIHGDLNDAEFI